MSIDSVVPGDEPNGGKHGRRGAGAALLPSPQNSSGWWKSSYSNSPPDCVEVARSASARVMVRDSVHPRGVVLRFTVGAWREFLAAVRHADLG